MDRVVVLGRGGAGKSVLARELGARIDAEVIELDKVFWNSTGDALPIHEWADRQGALAESERWVMDGDLGPYDVLEPRLLRATTVIVLDLPAALCAWRALRRGRERCDFWAWTLRWRHKNRARLLAAIDDVAPDAELSVLTSRRSVRRWLQDVEASTPHDAPGRTR